MRMETETAEVGQGELRGSWHWLEAMLGVKQAGRPGDGGYECAGGDGVV